MGGPGRDSYRAAEEARRRQRDALRTRDGVVDLAELRAALKAAEFLRTTHGEVPFLLAVRVVVAPKVGFEIEVVLVRDDEMLRRCLPCRVNDVPVRVVARNPERVTSR